MIRLLEALSALATAHGPWVNITEAPRVAIAENGGDDPSSARCRARPVARDARLIVLGFYEGAGMSSVAVAGETVETTTGEIRIAPGKGKFVLALTSYDSMLFQLSGATDRIAQVVLVHRSGSGVTGVPRARVRFITASECQFGYAVPQNKPGPRPLIPALGRRPDLWSGSYELDVVRLDDRGITSIAPRRKRWTDGSLSETTREMYRFYPAGVVRIDPRSVASARAPRSYVLLPSTAGAAQLEREGAIVRMDKVAEAALRTLVRVRNPIDGSLMSDPYRVARPTRLPIGLCGAHLMTFVVSRPSDVSGDPCHSMIVTTDGKILAGPFLDRRRR